MFLRCLVLLLVLGPMAAWAQSQGILLYERGEYSRAARVLTNEVNNPRRSEKDRARARVYLAAALMELGKRDEAQAQLEELLRTYPEQRVDPALFPPELVELDRVVRAEVETERLRKEAEQAERERLAAEAERERLAAEEAERRKREAEALRQTPQPEGEVRDSAEPRATSSFRLRPEVVGYSDFVGRRSIGFGGGVTVGSGPLEGTVRVLGGVPNIGVELEAGVVIGSWAFQPRVSVRGLLLPVLQLPTAQDPKATGTRLGVVGAVGGRLALSSRVTALADVGYGWLFGMPAQYNDRVFVASAGLGFNLF
jgi:hypothetical protein